MSIFGESITVKPLHMKLGAHNCEKKKKTVRSQIKQLRCENVEGRFATDINEAAIGRVYDLQIKHPPYTWLTDT